MSCGSYIALRRNDSARRAVGTANFAWRSSCEVGTPELLEEWLKAREKGVEARGTGNLVDDSFDDARSYSVMT